MRLIKQSTDKLGRQVDRKEFKITKRAKELIKQIENNGYEVVLEERSSYSRGISSESVKDTIFMQVFNITEEHQYTYSVYRCSFAPSNKNGFYSILEEVLTTLPDIFVNAREVKVAEITDDLDPTALLMNHTKERESDSFDFFALFT